MNTTTDHTTPRHERIRCARCACEILVNHPDVDSYLTVSGWHRSIVIQGAKERTMLADGTEALVERPARVVRTAWCCSLQCCREIAIARHRDDVDAHFVDGGSASGRAALKAGSHSTPPNSSHEPREKQLACGGCGAFVTLDLGHTTGPALTRALAAYGWHESVSGKYYCSGRCAQLANFHAAQPEVKAVERIDDVTYQARRPGATKAKVAR